VRALRDADIFSFFLLLLLLLLLFLKVTFIGFNGLSVDMCLTADARLSRGLPTRRSTCAALKGLWVKTHCVRIGPPLRPEMETAWFWLLEGWKSQECA